MMGRSEGYILVDLLVGLAIFAIVLGSAQSITRQFLMTRTFLESDASQRALAIRSVMALTSRLEQARLSMGESGTFEGGGGPISDWVIPQPNSVVGALTRVSIHKDGTGLWDMRLFFGDASRQVSPRPLMQGQEHLNMEIIVPTDASQATNMSRLWLGLQMKTGTGGRGGMPFTSVAVPAPRFSPMLCMARPYEQRCLR